MLYSVIRLSRDGATYDLPVDGDWLTIAVVAERGEVKISGTKNTSKNDDDSDDGEEPEEGGHVKDPKKPDFKKKGKPEYKKRPPRKYINLKLCSLPPRSRSGSSTSGDALLQLLLFESDSVATQVTENEEGEKVTTKRYLGGSGGAYERWCNLTVGSVIAIMNPKVLRPLRVSPSLAPSGLEQS
jgi:minichromosome maintenance protein 10